MVAVKIPTMKDHNVEAVKKDLKREILTMNSLDHPNIVKLLGISDSKAKKHICLCFNRTLSSPFFFLFAV